MKTQILNSKPIALIKALLHWIICGDTMIRSEGKIGERRSVTKIFCEKCGKIFYRKYASEQERFKTIFGEYPESFNGLQSPYYFQQYGQEGAELLQLFGFCHMCDGSGVAFSECCNGYKCECGGGPVPFSCHVCNGTGRLPTTPNISANLEHLTSVAKSNGGYLFPKTNKL